MSFFYNLNNKLNAIRDLPSTTHGQLNERDMSRAAKGYEKYGKEGMEALAKAGRDGKALDPVRAKYDKYDNTEVDEGLGDMARRVGGAVKKVAGKALNTLGHGDDADVMRDLQKKMGVPQTGMKPGSEPNPKQIKEKMSPAKAKSFAALAEPKDKITFADKIAGAKKEVDEMLGDVAAEAMKQALGGGKGRNAEMDEEASQGNAFTAHKRPKVEKPAVGSVTHGRKHDVEEIPGGRRVTRRTDLSGISVGADDEAAQSGEKRGRGRPKKAGGPAQERVTANSRKADRTRFQSKKKTNEAVSEDDIEVLERLMHEAFDEGNNTLGNALQAVLERIQGDQDEDQYDDDEQVNEKAVSKKQQRFMGMVHAAKKGEKPASKEVAKAAKGMGKKDAEDFAATKHKGLPEKKKPEGKKEKTEETSDSTPSKGGMKFGGGIYDSMNRDLENMIAESMARLDESMSINMSMNNDEHGGPSKSLTVTATDEDAMKLSQLLKSAGLGGGDEEGYGGGGYKSACGCGTPDCSCGEEQMDEVSMNQPDYPTETETSSDAMQYAGGLNKPKATGQTTTPVIASQDDRQHSYAEAEEDAIKRMMEMAGMSQNNRLDEGMMDKLKSFAVPKLMKLLGPDAEKIASAVKQATGGDLTPSKENAMKVVQALGINKAATQGQSPQMAEGVAGNWQGKLIQALYTLGLLGSAGAAASMYGTVGGSFMGVVGVLLLMFAATFFGDEPGQVGTMGNFGNKGTDMNAGLDDHGMPIRTRSDTTTNPYKGQGGFQEQTDLDRMMEMAGIAEAKGKKPDFLDVDKDGDKKEPFKKAVDDKKEEKVQESIFALTNQWRAYKG
jgi:hypothetical protein